MPKRIVAQAISIQRIAWRGCVVVNQTAVRLCIQLCENEQQPGSGAGKYFGSAYLRDSNRAWTVEFVVSDFVWFGA
jgi:hypothetical protein